MTKCAQKEEIMLFSKTTALTDVKKQILFKMGVRVGDGRIWIKLCTEATAAGASAEEGGWGLMDQSEGETAEALDDCDYVKVRTRGAPLSVPVQSFVHTFHDPRPVPCIPSLSGTGRGAGGGRDLPAGWGSQRWELA